MSGDVRKEAQKRAERVASFKEELAELAREGGLTLSTEQQQRLDTHLEALLSGLRSRYGADATESAKRVSWGMRIVSLLGAAALFAALVLFLHRVWGQLTTPLQVTVLAIGPLTLLIGAEVAFARRAGLYYVALLALGAGVAFVMAVDALGAALNLTDSPMVLLAWGSFAVLVAYAYGLRLMLGAGLVLACAWSAAVVLHIQGFLWAEFPQRSELLIPGAVVLYAIPWLVRRCGPDGFDLVYRLCGSSVGLLALLVLSTAGDVCCGEIAPGTVAGAYQILGLLGGSAVLYHGLRLGRAALVNLGAAAFLVFLFVRLHSWWWDWMPKYLFCLALATIAFGLLLLFRRIRSRMSKETMI